MNRSTDPEEHGNRLYSEAQELKAKLKKLQDDQREKECAGQTFSPKTNVGPPSSSSQGGSTLTERMALFEERKQKKIAEKKKAKEDAELDGYTFKPELTSSSASRSSSRSSTPLAHSSRNRTATTAPSTAPSQPRTSLSSSLTASGRKSASSYHSAEKTKKEMDQECTFSPKITQKAQRYSSPNSAAKMSEQRKETQSKSKSPTPTPSYRVHDSLYIRGQIDQQVKEERRHDMAIEISREQGHTFSPTLTKKSKKLSAASSTKDAPLSARVSESRHFVETVLSKIKTELDLKDCTFSPMINKKYRGVTPRDKTPVYERLSKVGRVNLIWLGNCLSIPSSFFHFFPFLSFPFLSFPDLLTSTNS